MALASNYAFGSITHQEGSATQLDVSTMSSSESLVRARAFNLTSIYPCAPVDPLTPGHQVVTEDPCDHITRRYLADDEAFLAA